MNIFHVENTDLREPNIMTTCLLTIEVVIGKRKNFD